MYQKINKKSKKCDRHFNSFLPRTWTLSCSLLQCVGHKIWTFCPRHICFIGTFDNANNQVSCKKKVGVTISGLLGLSLKDSNAVKSVIYKTQPMKIDLDNNLDSKQKTSILMPKGSEKLEMKMLWHGKQELPANQYQPICQQWTDWPALVIW